MTARSGPNWKRIARIAGTILSLGLLIFLLSRQGWEEIIAALSSIQIFTLLLAAFLVLLSRFAVVGRWFALLRSAHIPFSIIDTFKLTFAGLFAANFLPTTVGGDVVRLAEVGRVKDKKAAYAASVVMDRAVGLLGMAILVPFGLAEAISNLNFFKQGLLGVLLLTNFNATLGRRFEETLQGYVIQPAKAFWQALKVWLQNPQGLLVSMGFTAIHMLCRFGAIWFVFRDQGESVGLLEIASLWSLVYFITLIPISLNGLGLQEISTTFMFTQVGGVAASSALTIAILLRFLEMAASLPGAFFLPGIINDPKGELS